MPCDRPERRRKQWHRPPKVEPCPRWHFMGGLVPGDERREDSVHQNVGGKSAKESPGLARRASSPLKKGQQENPGCSGCHHLKFTLQRTRKPEIDGGQIVRAKIN